ncbi:MAG TPA: hemerythrin domain-containing protein [Sphingomicrobium sp.]|nr:hemerythrin domain-containing protein [Sphingomicrobium sp.]
MSELSKLRDDHFKLARMFMQLGRIIESSTPPSNIELFEVRRELVSTLIAHLKLEDWALYPRLIECGEDDIASAGLAFKDEMGGLAPAFLAYCDKWSATSIEADWAGYCADTRAILDALSNRLTREDRELLPLLDRLDRAA